MKGNIYCEQKCPICGGNLIYDPGVGECFCKKHPTQKGTARFKVHFGRDVKRRFKDLAAAERFLNGLRFKTDERTFDALDYRADTPYAFSTLVKEYLQEKEGLASYRKVKRHMDVAVDFFGDTNIKAIKRRDLKLFQQSLAHLSSKTQHNYLAQLHNFFHAFLVDEEVLGLADVPRFPPMGFELGYRNLVDLDTQAQVMEAMREITSEVCPKVYLAADMLRTYLSLRPGDLLRINEGHVRLDLGAVLIERPTKTRGRMVRKVVHLLDEHAEAIAAFKAECPALPNVPFFRHKGGVKGTRPNQPWGEKYVYKWWKLACEKVGVAGVDLYGGTRHSTTTALAIEYGEDDAKAATEHATNRAFERYCQAGGARAKKMVSAVAKLHGKVSKIHEGIPDVSHPQKTANKNK